MTVKSGSISVLDTASTTWTARGASNQFPVENITQYRDCTVSVGDTGSAVLTVDYGEGFQTLATLATGDYDTYLIPGAVGIKATASGGDITVTFISHSKNT